MTAGTTSAPAHATAAWLPDFCTLPVLFATIFAVELAVCAIQLSPGNDSPLPLLARLGPATLYAQGLAMLCLVCLCSLNGSLRRLPPIASMFAAWALILLMVLLGSAAAFLIDQQGQLPFALLLRLGAHFVLHNVALAALIGAALLRYFFVLGQWQAQVRAEAQARLDALQARIRPHFLFNSMNTIASLIRSDPPTAERAIEDLSDLFRAALLDEDKSATLGDELELAQRYLAIERLRLGERLRVEIDLADDLPRDLPVPALLLQPLIENAIHHGIAPLPGGGTLTLRAQRTQTGGARIAIANPRPPPNARPPVRHGMALTNTRSRIEYHFGRRGALSIEEDAEHFLVVARLG